ncbi:NfeD family protein [Hydrogenimonas sp. SS33]|uniref:NfeD family protein n=1 Tax=Hydrogenimonas leucolamina TaxID=2954236 RepID=UPI00336BC6C8
MEYLAQTVAWWHWIVLGIILSAAEILIPSFIVLWFGLAAIAVGIIDLLFGTGFTTELYLWILLSVLFLAIYFRFFKKHEPVPSVGQAEGEYADIPGVIVKDLGGGRYKARFDLPVLGDRVWVVEPEGESSFREGDKIKVAHVYGQIVKVKGVSE